LLLAVVAVVVLAVVMAVQTTHLDLVVQEAQERLHLKVAVAPAQRLLALAVNQDQYLLLDIAAAQAVLMRLLAGVLQEETGMLQVAAQVERQ
jgi:hypothetical protein